MYIATTWVLLAATGCAALKIEGVERLSNRRGPATLVPPLALAWTYNAGAGFGHEGALVVGDYVLVATRNGDLHAVALDSGKRRGIKSFGDALESAPLLEGTTLFVPVDMGRRALYAYDLERSIVTGRRQGPPVAAGLLPLDPGFISVDVQAVMRRHRGLGVVWEQRLPADRFVHTRPVFADGKVIVADDRGAVHAFDPETGARQWTADAGAPVYSAMGTHSGRVYVSTTRARHVALDASSGRLLWAFTLPDTTIRLAGPAVDASLVVFGGTDGTVVALEARSGEEKWRWQAPDAIVAAPYLNQHVVYLGSMGSVVYALDRNTGAVLWEEKLRGRIKSAITGHDDFLLVLSEPRYVYLLRADEAAL